MADKASKLVRDKIPDLIRESGREPVVNILSGEEFKTALKAKLMEEVKEYCDSEESVELADVYEVLRKLAELDGISWSEIEELRLQKFSDRGGFNQGYYLVETKN